MYISITELQNRFNRFTFGTTGNDIMTVGEGTTLIGQASNFMDLKLSKIYGTIKPVFGTNAWGTNNLPPVIVDICADVSLGYIYQNTQMYVEELQQVWADKIYSRGTTLLGCLAEGEQILSPFSGTLTETQETPFTSNYGVSLGESVALNGTDLTNLSNLMLVPSTIKVYGTSALNPLEYVRGRDYNVWEFGGDKVGSHYGNIASTGTGSIPAGATVRVDYEYYLTNNMHINDFLKWGEQTPERRG